MKKSMLITTAVILMTSGALFGQQGQSTSRADRARAMANQAKQELQSLYKAAEATLGVYVENVSSSYILQVKDITFMSSTINPGHTEWVAAPNGKTITVSALNMDGTPVEDAKGVPLTQKITRTGNVSAYKIEVGKIFTTLTTTCRPSTSAKVCVKPLSSADLKKELSQ